MFSDLPKFLIAFFCLVSSAFASDRIQVFLESSPPKGYVVYPDTFPFNRDYFNLFLDGVDQELWGWDEGVTILDTWPDFVDALEGIDDDGNYAGDMFEIMNGLANPWLDRAIQLETASQEEGEGEGEENLLTVEQILCLILGVNLFGVAVHRSYL